MGNAALITSSLAAPAPDETSVTAPVQARDTGGTSTARKFTNAVELKLPDGKPGRLKDLGIGEIYRIQRSTNLVTWTDNSGDIIPLQATVTATSQPAPASPNGFYRVTTVSPNPFNLP